MKRVAPVVLVAVVAMLAAAAAADASGGNSGNLKRCMNQGWQSLYRYDGSQFKSQGECVSYAAKGGMLETEAEKAAHFYCDRVSGTFGDEDLSNGANPFVPSGLAPVWTCNYYPATMITQLDVYGFPLIYGLIFECPVTVLPDDEWSAAWGAIAGNPTLAYFSCWDIPQ